MKRMKKNIVIMIAVMTAIALLASCSPEPANKERHIERMEKDRVSAENKTEKDGIITGGGTGYVPGVGASHYLRSSVWEDESGELRASFDEKGMPESPKGFETVKKSESAASVVYETVRELTLIDGSTEITRMTSEFEIIDMDTVLASFVIEVTGEPSVSRSAVLVRK